jgi:hypothetical protein
MTSLAPVHWAWSLAAALFIAGCGKSDVGEECDESGATDECVDGAICTNQSDGDDPVCRTLCVDQEDCPKGQACNGVSGTNQKSCQPDVK